jgi:hypothetical protein
MAAMVNLWVLGSEAVAGRKGGNLCSSEVMRVLAQAARLVIMVSGVSSGREGEVEGSGRCACVEFLWS